MIKLFTIWTADLPWSHMVTKGTNQMSVLTAYIYGMLSTMIAQRIMIKWKIVNHVLSIKGVWCRHERIWEKECTLFSLRDWSKWLTEGSALLLVVFNEGCFSGLSLLLYSWRILNRFSWNTHAMRRRLAAIRLKGRLLYTNQLQITF